MTYRNVFFRSTAQASAEYPGGLHAYLKIQNQVEKTSNMKRNIVSCEPLSKLLVSPLITLIVVPYIIPYITPFKEFRP